MTTSYKLPRPGISDSFPYESRYVMSNSVRMHYVEIGEGDPIVFIHGNPTSSYLWRNVIPYVAQRGRAIALDLVGMGRSDKPATAFPYAQQFDAVAGFIAALELRNITFVLHDWGAALGFDYASRHPDHVLRIAFMEGVLPPFFPQPSFEAMGAEMGGMFRGFKDPVQGRKMIIEDHIFVEEILPGFVNRPLSATEMAAYREPFIAPENREAILMWPREIPIAGEPASNVALMNRIQMFMTRTSMPALLLYAEPGVVVPPSLVPWYAQRIRNLETAYVGRGLHYIPEDQPDAIGRALADWMRRNA